MLDGLRFFILPVLAAASVSACQSAPPQPAGMRHNPAHVPAARHIQADAVADYREPRVIDLNAMPDLDAIIPRLAPKRVVFIGETHNRYDHHLNELEIIRRLYGYNPDLAIGMEFFQQPFQKYLDQFIAGKLNEKEFLRRTQYYDRWRFDYRLYKPILDFARANGIPVIALNLPSEITTKVGKSGMGTLSDAERAMIPKHIDRSNPAYQERLYAIFEHHPGNADFQRFMDVQLLWDEGMAARIARYLKDNPDRNMVVLAGSGHLIYGTGIPERVVRRVQAQTAIVLNGDGSDVEPGMGDFLLLPEPVPLPPNGRLGAFLDIQDDAVKVSALSESSAAKAAGVREGDVILDLDGAPIRSYADLKIALLEKKPGDVVSLKVRRSRWLLGDEDLDFSVSLR